jgi:hypothetical protein
MSEIRAQAGEKKALEDLALADFAAAEGIALPANGASGSAGGDAAAQKTMGPAESQ